MQSKLAALNVSLTVAPGSEAEAARECHRRMREDEWAALVRLAAEVIALQESLATGTVVLVAPVSAEHLAAVVRRMR